MAWLDTLLKLAVEKGASDLHVSSQSKPILRVHGHMTPIEGLSEISADNMAKYIQEIVPKENWAEFQSTHDSDCAYEIAGCGRFRCNVFLDDRGPCAVFRVIPQRIPTLDELGIGPAFKEICFLKKGFVLVVGPTGSGRAANAFPPEPKSGTYGDNPGFPAKAPGHSAPPRSNLFPPRQELKSSAVRAASGITSNCCCQTR